MKCTYCSAENSANARFCMQCGRRLQIHPEAFRPEHINFKLQKLTPGENNHPDNSSFPRTVRRVLAIRVTLDLNQHPFANAPEADSILHEIREPLADIIQQYQGAMDQSCSDGILAFFGVPFTQEDDPQRAVMAALQINKRSKSLAKFVLNNYGLNLEVRISLYICQIILSNEAQIGTYDDPISDPLLGNLEELQSRIPPFRAIAADNAIVSINQFSNIHGVTIKSKRRDFDGYKFWEITSIDMHESKQQRDKPVSDFVGRQQEISTLNDLGATLLAGLGRICAISGPLGVGKSRLVAEWKMRFMEQYDNPDIRWIEVKAQSYSKNQPFHFINHLVYALLNLPENAPRSDAIKALEQSLDDAPVLEFEKISKSIAQIKHPVNPQDDEAFHISDLVAKDYYKMIHPLMRSLAKRQPLIILFDNLQWADCQSLTILENILPVSTETPVLFCLISRPERSSQGLQLVNSAGICQGLKVETIHLENLNMDESLALVSNLLNASQIPPGFIDLIFKQTEGNPFFILETMQMLIRQKVIRRLENNWVIPREMEALKVPDTIEHLLFAQIDDLPVKARHILIIASILGRVFEARLLSEVLLNCLSDLQPLQELSYLESAGFISLHAIKPFLQYKFNHFLLYQAIYQSIFPADRSNLHLLVADALEKQYTKTPEKAASQLAHHYHKGGNFEKARNYYTLGAKEALSNHAVIEAESNYRQALALVGDPPEKADLLAGLGQSLSDQARYPDAIGYWLEALEIYKSEKNYDRVARLYAWLSRASWWINDLEQNLSYCLEGLKLVKGKQKSAGVAYLLHECGRTYLFNNDLKKAQQYIKSALKMARELNAMDVQAEVLATMGVFPTLSATEAISLLEDALEIAETNHLNSSASRAYINLAAIVENLGQIRLALDYRQRAIDLGMDTGNLSDEFYIQAGIINNKIMLCRYNDVRVDIERMKQVSTQQAQELKDEHLSILLWESQLERQLGNSGRAYDLILSFNRAQRQRGDLEQLLNGNLRLGEILVEPIYLEDNQVSRNNLDIVLTILNEHLEAGASPETHSQLMGLLALVHALRNDQAKAKVYWNKVNDDSQYASSQFEKSQLRLISARLAASQQDWQGALENFEACEQEFSKMEARWWQAHTWLEIALIHIHRQDAEGLERSQNLLRDALSVFKELGSSYYPDLIIDKLRIVKQLSKELAITSRKQKHELSEAGKVQTSFIPARVPDLPGWQIAAALEPARETSGDYYDFIDLPGDRIGVVIADVGDKGAGAALYMALSRTLMRTFALEHANTPEMLMNKLNQRIMQDTQEGIFLTLVYGILDPQTKTFTYSNAGHNPPIVINPKQDDPFSFLDPTGMLVGLFKEGHWHQKVISLAEGEIIVFYTDGVTEVENEQDDFYGKERLLRVLTHNKDSSAQLTMEAILKDVHNFVGEKPIVDDITLIVIKKG
jgi:serine phosphatase RsbU (regulator of sigma subunit)